MKRLWELILGILVTASVLSGCASKTSGDSPEVLVFNAGKADTILIHTSSSAILIDCGEEDFADEILEKLEEYGIKTLDALIITHFDKDHVGGAAHIVRSLNIKQVIQSDFPKDSDEYKNYTASLKEKNYVPITVSANLSFMVDSVKYYVYPHRSESYEDSPSNNSSLITIVVYGDTKFLFMGDAETQRIAEFLEENDETYDFLKVPYHGHYQELLEELIAEVMPNHAAITSSSKEKEDDATVELLEKYGASVWLARNGNILVKTDGTTVTVTQE